MFEFYIYYLKLRPNEIIHGKIMGRKEKDMRTISWDSLMFRSRAWKDTANNAKGDELVQCAITEIKKRGVLLRIRIS